VVRRGAVAAALAALALAPASAGAHVGIEPATAPAGAEVTFTVTVPHGCAGSPTTAIALKLPASIRAAWPAPAPGWSLESTPAGDLADQGGETAQRIDIVRWADGDLPDGELGELRLRLALPDEPGAVLAIPAIQTCADGETRWIQIPAAGESPEDLAAPAPTITLTAAGGAAGADPDGDGALAAALAALLVAVLGLGLASIIAIRSRRGR
jgi:uncharacterized protein YcnI